MGSPAINLNSINGKKLLLQQHAMAAAGGNVAALMQPPSIFSESLNWQWYDQTTIAAGATAPSNTVLFQTPVGQSGKTLAQTNMTGNGVLPATQAFVVTGLSISYSPMNLLIDVVNWALATVVTFQISDKIYLQEPAYRIPGGSTPIMNAVANQGASVATDGQLVYSTANGATVVNNVYHFTIPQPIYVQEQFQVSLTIPGTAPQLASATPGVPTATLPSPGTGLAIQVFLHGILYRNVR